MNWSGIFVLFVIWLGSLPGLASEILTEVETLNKGSFQHGGTLWEIKKVGEREEVLSSSSDETVRHWDMATGKLLRVFSSPKSGDLWGILVLPGEKEFLVSSDVGKVYRFELASGKLVRTYQEGKTRIYRLALHPDGQHFASVGDSGQVRLWNLESGEIVQSYEGHKQSVYSAIIYPDEKTLLTGSEDKTMKRWDLETGKCLETYSAEKPGFGEVYTIAMSPDQKSVAMISDDNHVRVFDSGSMEEKWKTRMSDEGQVVAWSPDGSRLAATSDDGSLYIFDPKDGTTVKNIEVSGGSHTPIVFSPDGTKLYSGGDSLLYLHDVKSGERIELEQGDAAVSDKFQLALVKSGGNIIVACSDLSWAVWDRQRGGAPKVFDTSNEIGALAMSDDGKLIALGLNNGAVQIFDTDNFELQKTTVTHEPVASLAFMSDGRRLVSGGNKGWISMWDWKSGKILQRFAGHQNAVTSVNFLSSEQLATTGKDFTIRLWSLATGAEEAAFMLKAENPNSLAFLDDGKTILAATGTSSLWGRFFSPNGDEESPDPEVVKTLANDLNDADFSKRQSASNRLAELGNAGLEILRNLAKDDPELKARIEGVVEVLRREMLHHDLQVLLTLDGQLETLANNSAGEFWAGVQSQGGPTQVVIGGSKSGKVEIFDSSLNLHQPQNLSFSQDGDFIVTTNRDGTLSLYQVQRPVVNPPRNTESSDESD